MGRNFRKDTLPSTIVLWLAELRHFLSLSLSPVTYHGVLVDDAGDAFVVDLVDKYLYV